MEWRVHRIQTEDVNRDGIIAVLDKAFESYSITSTLGRWRGVSECSLTVEITGAKRAAVATVAEEIRAMNNQEAVLVTEFVPSAVKFMYRCTIALLLCGVVSSALLEPLLLTAPLHKTQKSIEHMAFDEAEPPQPGNMSELTTAELVKEFEKRFLDMDQKEKRLILKRLQTLLPPPPLNPEPWKSLPSVER